MLQSRALVGSLVVALVLFAAVPLVMREARTAEFEATVELVPVQYPLLPPVRDQVSQVRDALADEIVQRHVVSLSGFLYDARSLPERTTVERAGRMVRISVEARSPDRARDLADAVAQAVVVASGERLAGEVGGELQRIRDQLEAGELSRSERTELLGTVKQLRELVGTGLHRFVVHQYASAPAVSGGAVDRAVDALPGAVPPVPGRAAAAAYGLLFVGILFVGVFAVRRSRE
ncbi:MAG: hypothetical protein M3N24_07695 [Actinomycetota bacterium]|nr:hypothetical protein [Actinomycetota bacterium]